VRKPLGKLKLTAKKWRDYVKLGLNVKFVMEKLAQVYGL
jgi:hypothetical protein